MRVKMKLVVPLTMPSTRLTLSPASDSRSGRSNGIAPADAGFEEQVDAVLVGRVVQGGAVFGEQRLVRGDDRSAARHRGQNQRAGGLDAAHHLDHDVDVVAPDQFSRVGGEQRRVDLDRSGCAALPHGDTGKFERRADPGGEVVRVFVQQPDDLGRRRRRSPSSAMRTGRAVIVVLRPQLGSSGRRSFCPVAGWRAASPSDRTGARLGRRPPRAGAGRQPFRGAR